MDISVIKAVLASTAEGVSITSPDRKVVFCNKAFLDITGYDETEILGQTLSILQGPDCDVDMVESMNDCMDRGVEFAEEILNYRKNGESFWNHMRIKPYFGDHGNVEYFIGVMRDITKRRDAEEKASAIESEYEFMFENVQAGVVLHKSNTEIIYANPMALKLLGVEAQSVDGALNTDPRWSFVNEDLSLLALSEYPVAQALSKGSPVKNQVFGNRRDSDGELRWLICNAFPVIDKTGEITKVLTSFTDITELKETERRVQTEMQRLQSVAFELEESDARFKLVAATVSDVVWDRNFETGELWITDGWLERLGLADQLFGTDLNGPFDYAGILNPGEVQHSLDSALGSDADAWSHEYDMADVSGSVVTVRAYAAILRDNEGHAYRMVGSLKNITIEKRQQEGYSRSRALEAVGQLTGGIAHDFNNLLMVIQGNAELLSMSELSEDDAESVSLINDASQSSAMLTQRLLSFAGQSPLISAHVVIGDLIPKAIRLLEAGVTENVEIKTVIPDDVWDVQIDANGLEQALVNLVLNAKDAMPNGGAVTISCENCSVDSEMAAIQSEMSPGDYVVLSVTDTGEGIAQEYQSKVLEPFFTTKDVGKGTGLGLSTVFGFVKQSGGHLTMYSEFGQGASFSLYLPKHGKEVPNSDAPEELVAEPVLAAGQRILIVEDQPQVRQQVEKFISFLGYDTMCASDGNEALALIESGEAFDLLFSDVIMPNQMSGPELAKAVIQKTPRTKVLFTSGYPAAAFDDIGLSEMANQPLLRKPYKLADLKAALEKGLQGTVRANVPMAEDR